MGFVQPATVKAIALSVDITHLTEDAAKLLAPDVEYRLREVIQDALKFAKHSKRTQLTTHDINNALRLQNIEPLYGFLGNNDPAKFVRAAGFSDVYFVRDSTVPLEQITSAPLPKAPNATTVMPHWLFIDGQQPQTEENQAVDRPAAKRARLAAGPGGGQGGAAGGKQQQAAGGPGAKDAAGQRRKDGAAGEGGGVAATGEKVALPVQHILSDEMQRLLEEVKSILANITQPPPGTHGELWSVPGDEAGGWGGNNLYVSPIQRAVLATVRTDPGMQQLLPYLSKFVADEVAGGLRQLPRLHMTLRLVEALLANPCVALEPYLAQLMPSLLTCMLAKSLGSGPGDDHWALRDAAARVVARVCGRFGEPYYSLQVKVSKQLLRALLDGSKPLTSHYGAVVGLAALGHATVRLLLIPQVEPYVAKLAPALDARKEGVRQYEAGRVYGALMSAVGCAMYDKLISVAADTLPYHLFLASRSRRPVAALQGKTEPGADAGPTGPLLRGGTSAAGGQGGGVLVKAEPGGPSAPPLPHPVLALMGPDGSEPAGAAAAVGALRQQVQRGVLTPAGLGGALQQLREQAGVGNAGAARALAVLQQAVAQGQLPQPAAAPPAGQGGQQGAGPSGGAQPAVRQEGAGGDGAGERSARAILAESWREDADLGEVVWALTEVFGEPFLSRLPQPGRLPSLLI